MDAVLSHIKNQAGLRGPHRKVGDQVEAVVTEEVAFFIGKGAPPDAMAALAKVRPGDNVTAQVSEGLALSVTKP